MSKELEVLYEIMQDLARDEHDDSGFTITEIVDKLILIKKALIELEELKRDVKRYFELIWIFKNTMWACEEDSKPYLDEYTLLKDKLLKTGEEE